MKDALYKAFVKEDLKKTGILDQKEFSLGLQTGLSPVFLSFAEAQVLLQLCDPSNSGNYNYVEFLRRFQPGFAQMLRKRYGMDSESIIKRICEALFAKKESLTNIFSQMDHDGDGTVSSAEFEVSFESC